MAQPQETTPEQDKSIRSLYELFGIYPEGTLDTSSSVAPELSKKTLEEFTAHIKATVQRAKDTSDQPVIIHFEPLDHIPSVP